jgi:serine/threonine protein kinase
VAKLKSPLALETAFAAYTLDEILGEGGAGRVYGGKSAEGTSVAIKVLTKTSRDKRARFKNEIAFLSRNRHPNIVTVFDYGLANEGSISGPFYVMSRFASNLRTLMTTGISPGSVLSVFGKVLDGVEAAHLQGVVHRDLKPENVLSDSRGDVLAVADFGIASFTESLLVTAAQTGPTQRLANFQYAAPEQRLAGRVITKAADVYALGLMLNEMFTRQIPHGTEFELIARSHPDFGYLDAVVAQMLRQNPSERPASIDAVKDLLQRSQSTEISRQKLSAINKEVVKVGEIDDDLAHTPPQIVAAEWDGAGLTITFDKPVHESWVRALNSMGNYEAVWNRGPEAFKFSGKTARVPASSGEAQLIINHLKNWLPRATARLKYDLEQKARADAEKRRRELAEQKAREESLLNVNTNLRF